MQHVAQAGPVICAAFQAWGIFGHRIVEGCDLAVAAEDAKMGLSEINFKMFPGGSVGKSMGNLLRPRDYTMIRGRTADGWGTLTAAACG